MRKLLYILPLFLGFILTGGPAWQQQYMPNLGGQSLQDMTFLDSLIGFAVSSKNVNPDSSSILRTTNGGDNWQIIFSQTPRRFSNIKFINSLTGFVSGGSGSGTPYLYKTTDGGNNWFIIPGATMANAFWNGMSMINEDTIFLIDANSFNGGVFRTTNGGVNWTQQFSGGNQNPNKIYIYNGQFGFMSNSSALPKIYRTTNSGQNWDIVVNDERFLDMEFVDNFTGWRTGGGLMKKTTDGGLNWTVQAMPSGGMIFSNNALKLSVLSKDTIWANGGYVLFPNNQVKSILYRTTNGGTNWHYQLPDTSLQPFEQFLQLIDRSHGWAYSINPTGIHTTIGGDTNWITGIQQISTELPTDFRLYQNFPNPFNPTTSIKFKVQSLKNVKLSIFDITGKEVTTLVNGKLSPGEYGYIFDGSLLPSGVYFYSLFIDNKIYDTKKMMLVK